MPKKHNCEERLQQQKPDHTQANDGDLWVCECGKVYEHICDEAKGCSWQLTDYTDAPKEPGPEDRPQNLDHGRSVMTQWQVRLKCTAECFAKISVEADTKEEAETKAIEEATDLDFDIENVDEDSIEVLEDEEDEENATTDPDQPTR